MKKAHITFQGGLGNQMFQYLFLNYIKNIGYKTYADISLYSKTKMHSGFMLDKVFDIDLIYSPDNKVLSNNKFIKKFFSLNFGQNKVVTEENFNQSVLSEFTNIRFIGYWQTSYFVNEMYSSILSLFIFNVELSVEAKTILELIEITNSVAIHIRKGDYVDEKNKKIFGLCSSNYYSRSLELLKSKSPDINELFVFSDDIDYSKQLLSSGLDYTFVEINNEVEELYLMHKCKHQIIANSTFSWWGATLNTNKNKIIVYPNPWYDKVSEHVHIPSEWLPIRKK